MSRRPPKKHDRQEPSSKARRKLLTSTAGLATYAASGLQLGAATASAAAVSDDVPRAPFDTFRDYIAALEANGLLLRFDRVDQDAYEATGLMFEAVEKFGMFKTPAMLFAELKIDGEWMRGPVLANFQGHWNCDCVVFGLEAVPGEHFPTTGASRHT